MESARDQRRQRPAERLNVDEGEGVSGREPDIARNSLTLVAERIYRIIALACAERVKVIIGCGVIEPIERDRTAGFRGSPEAELKERCATDLAVR